MNHTAWADSGREKKVRCLVSQLDRMKNAVGATDDQLHEFASGLTDTDWAQLTADAQEYCDHGVTHTHPSSDAQRDAVNTLFARFPNRKANGAMQVALTALLHRSRTPERNASEIRGRVNDTTRRMGAV